MAERVRTHASDASGRAAIHLAGWILAAAPAAATMWLVIAIWQRSDSSPLIWSWPWVPSLNVDLAFRLDGLSQLFALIITGVGSLIYLYSGGYLHRGEQPARYFLFLTVFMLAMLGLVLAENLITLLIFWELTSICSFLLIGHYHQRPAARSAAVQSLIVTSLGGQALLAAIILLHQVTDSLSMSDILTSGDVLRQDHRYTTILALILLAAATKSAQFPFHFWLPNAMEAPTPISAYLHSATMVTAGIYLLARFHPVLGETALWHDTVTSLCVITMLLGVWLAWRSDDLKRLLAYATIAGLAMMIFLLGLGTELAIQAALVYLVAHAAYKGTLFLVAGMVDHQAGSRSISQLRGLWRRMPLTAASAVLAALSMAGLPPALGFQGKEKFYEAAHQSPRLAIVFSTVAVLTGIGLVLAAGLAAVRPFFGSLPRGPDRIHEAGVTMLIGPVVLALLGVAMGIWHQPVADKLIAPATTTVVAHQVNVKLELWSGSAAILGLSVVSLAVGIAAYSVRAPLLRVTSWLRVLERVGPERWFTLASSGLEPSAAVITRTLQNGRLRFYVMMNPIVFVLAVGAVIVSDWDWSTVVGWPDIRLYEAILAVVILVGASRVVHAPTRLAAVIGLGVVGYGVALVFAMFGAPDVAMTQLAVETLVVILFVLVLYRLPHPRQLSSTWARIRDGSLAMAAGAIVTLLILGVTATQQPSRVAPFFREHALQEAHGRNIVNVILVDFRALDTFGEVTVLALAALGILALLRLPEGAQENR